ncbi:MAG: hypothetical protein BWX66_01258 [Deltaproteobacteria bacterium ADurb.Bin058]|nr:MAG: hypothetical protein BWX66_01258 [Deltaproteobacteria bacterium ADurb.Bin058]
MVLSINQLDLEVDSWIASDNTLGHLISDTLFNRRDELAWNGSTKDGVFELKACATSGWLHVDVTHAKLATSTGLFLVFTFHVLGDALDGFPVSDPRELHFNVNVEFLFQFLNSRQDVRLTKAVQQEFLGLVIT